MKSFVLAAATSGLAGSVFLSILMMMMMMMMS
jgi:hypothetical protein